MAYNIVSELRKEAYHYRGAACPSPKLASLLDAAANEIEYLKYLRQRDYERHYTTAARREFYERD